MKWHNWLGCHATPAQRKTRGDEMTKKPSALRRSQSELHVEAVYLFVVNFTHNVSWFQHFYFQQSRSDAHNALDHQRAIVERINRIIRCKCLLITVFWCNSVCCCRLPTQLLRLWWDSEWQIERCIVCACWTGKTTLFLKCKLGALCSRRH